RLTRVVGAADTGRTERRGTVGVPAPFRKEASMSEMQADLRISPYQVAEETFVIPWMLEAPPVGLFCMNSLVIRGDQPIIVDTGSPADRDGWLDNVRSVVDPKDVRWIFLSHDDRDHAGNLLAALDACPVGLSNTEIGRASCRE